MSEDKKNITNDLISNNDDASALKEMLDDSASDDFELFESIDEGGAASGALKAKKRERVWLYLGLIALLMAALLRLLLGPILDSQEQRTAQAVQIDKQLDLTNASAVQALSATANHAPFINNLEVLGENIEGMALPSSLAGRVANKLFGNGGVNATLSGAWDNYRNSAQNFIDKQEQVTLIKSKLVELSEQLTAASSDTISFVDAVAKEGRSKRNDKAKDRYLFLTSEAANLNGILNRLNEGTRGYYQAGSNLQSLSDDQNTFIVRLKETLNRIIGNSAAVVATAAEPLQQKIDGIESKLIELGDNAPALTSSRASLNLLRANSEEFKNSAQGAVNQNATVSLLGTLDNILPLLLVGFGIFAMWRFFTLQSKDLVQSEGSLSDALADQQESILKLLDEMSALADGDLTVEAEVTDQITGAIADSVNFAVIEMRELVSQINRASVEVANESELAVTNAQSVSTSNMTQADQITSAAAEMQKVTLGMREMSEQAHHSSEMAAESLKAANQGAQAVRDTIKGMEDMREQIQDTSKRIKRLGESSQRIGDIVALIDDIAEQTNILSLNAAIQASMAGEAGRGFAVVSDEVQSLAERSTEATKKIAELVTTIQNDTNDAVISMEKATQQVITGTKVADTAGGALAEIEDVSERLSGLIETISQRSGAQAQVVTNVAERVTLVSDSSSETSRKAQDSANSIAKLLELAKELETSVSRFKLPAS